MSEIILNLGSRYAAAFGFLASTNQPSAASLSKDYNLELYGDRDPNFENVKFTYENTEINFAKMPFVASEEGVGKILAPPPLISFSQQKTHIETQINGSDDVVVERWGTKAWDIRIRGLLIDVANRSYPEAQITKLYQLFQYNNVVKVAGTQFFDKDIPSLYFKSISFNGVQGFQDTMQFTLTARSIRPVGFSLLNPNL